MKNFNQKALIVLVILAVIGLAYSSYLAGYKASEHNLDSLLMTMSIDSNFVTAGLYEELPDNRRQLGHWETIKPRPVQWWKQGVCHLQRSSPKK